VTARAVYLLDTAGRVVGWPFQAEGRRPTGNLHEHISDFYTPDARAAGDSERDLHRAWEGWLEIEGWRVREDGSHFWASVMMSPFEDQAGRPLGFVLVLSSPAHRTGGERATGQILPTKFDRRKR
jgi:hypothetical protein